MYRVRGRMRKKYCVMRLDDQMKHIHIQPGVCPAVSDDAFRLRDRCFVTDHHHARDREEGPFVSHGSPCCSRSRLTGVREPCPEGEIRDELKRRRRRRDA